MTKAKTKSVTDKKPVWNNGDVLRVRTDKGDGVVYELAGELALKAEIANLAEKLAIAERNLVIARNSIAALSESNAKLTRRVSEFENQNSSALMNQLAGEVDGIRKEIDPNCVKLGSSIKELINEDHPQPESDGEQYFALLLSTE